MHTQSSRSETLRFKSFIISQHGFYHPNYAPNRSDRTSIYENMHGLRFGHTNNRQIHLVQFSSCRRSQAWSSIKSNKPSVSPSRLHAPSSFFHSHTRTPKQNPDESFVGAEITLRRFWKTVHIKTEPNGMFLHSPSIILSFLHTPVCLLTSA